MQLCKVRLASREVAVAVLENGQFTLLKASSGPAPTLAEILHADDPLARVRSLRRGPTLAADQVVLLPPVDRQEVWAAGVTYKRSREARERESQGAARFYDLVYTAPRPELFFKAPAWRVVGSGGAVRIRHDARWSVPEPEVALVLSPGGAIVGYTIGNDMSSRDIEGENPLYLPQAKFYDGSCSLGPVVTTADALPPHDQVSIRLTIERGGRMVFEGATSLGAMARTFTDLISWLTRELRFPDGVVLLTGTGIIPPDEFTLARGDVVAIEVNGIGRLVNPVE